MGLTREARMSRADFRASRSGRRVVGRSGAILVHVVQLGASRGPAGGGGGPVRVGFAVGRRIGDAVTRNRVRRRLREAAAAVISSRGLAPGRGDQHPDARGTLVVVRAQPGIADLTVEEMTRLLDRGLRRALDRVDRGAA